MSALSFIPVPTGEGCDGCGVEPCACPEAEAAIAAAAPPDFRPAPDALPGHAAAMEFLARRAELQALHGSGASCHPDRLPLCTLIDAGGRVDHVKGLLGGRPDPSDLERARLHIATIGAMMTSLYEHVSARLSANPGASQ